MFKFDNGIYWANKYGKFQWGIELNSGFSFYKFVAHFHTEMGLGFFRLNYLNK